MSHKPGIDIEILSSVKYEVIDEKRRKRIQTFVKHYIPWEMIIEIVRFLEETEYYNLIVVSKYFAKYIIPFFMKDWIRIDNDCQELSPQYFKMKIDKKPFFKLTNHMFNNYFRQTFGKGMQIILRDTNDKNDYNCSDGSCGKLNRVNTMSVKDFNDFKRFPNTIFDGGLANSEWLKKQLLGCYLEMVDLILNKNKIGKKQFGLFKEFRKSLEKLYLEIKNPKQDKDEKLEYSFSHDEYI